LLRPFRQTSIPGLIAAVFIINGFLNLATGLLPMLWVGADLGVDALPTYLRVTPAQQISGIVSVLLGVVMVTLGRGLSQRRRRAWGWALGLLLFVTANNLYRGTTPETSVLSVLLIIGLLVYRRRFSVLSATKLDYGQVIALASVGFALAYGIVGSYVMREQFRGIENWTDAIYYTFVTYSTLGYGDILPKTPDARLFVISMIVVGLGSFITTVTVVVGPMIERRMKGVLSIMDKFTGASNHVIVCGYSSVGESAIDELQEAGVHYLIIENRAEVAALLRTKGHDVLVGDATRRETLEEANLRGAQAVVAAFDSDSVNAMVTVTARQYRDSNKACHFRIITRVEDEDNVEKARYVGADEVVSPSTLGGRLMARKAAEGKGGTVPPRATGPET